MEDTDKLEEDLSNGDITGSYDRLQGNVSKVDTKADTKIDKFEGDRHVKIDNEKVLSPGLERSETDSDTTYPSRYILCIYFHNVSSWAWLHAC